MKKRFFLLVVLLAVAACIPEYEQMLNDVSRAEKPGENEFYATVETVGKGEPQTKVFADEQMRVLWNADDRITVFDKYTYAQEYRFEGKDGDNAGTFSPVTQGSFVTGNDLAHVYAVYPHGAATSISNDGVLSLNLPATQTYKAGSFGIGANTMVSVTDDNNLHFRNVGGYLSIKLYGEGISVSKVQLTGNHGETLSGEATVTMDVGGVPSLTLAGKSTPDTLTLLFESPVALAATETDFTEFWFVVPPTTFTNGLSIVVTDSDGGKFIKSTSKPVTISRNNLTRMEPVKIPSLAPNAPSTCAEVIACPDSKTYMVTGICVAIENAKYGNWYLEDETGQIYIYGTVNAAGNYAWRSFGIEVGDEVTVQGPKTTYNGRVELCDAQVVKVKKSLIKVAGTDPGDAILPVEGGEFKVMLNNEGNGVNVENLPSWLSISALAGNTIVFTAEPNEDVARDCTITFRTNDGKKDYICQLTIFQRGSILECSVAEFLATSVSNTQFRLTGIITGLYASDKQGKSFYIADWSGETLVYRADNFDSTLEPGDIVTVVGKRGAYNDSPQMSEGHIETIVDLVDAVTIPEFVSKEDSSTEYYMVTGTIDEIANEIYGYLYMKDSDGNRLYVFGCYPGYGATGEARKGVVAAKGLKVGDILTVIGPKITYKGEAQVNRGIYFSHVPAN